MASRARRPTVLIVLHQEHSTPGRVGLALRAMDVRLDIRRPSLGEPLPRTLAGHDGVVVFGGPMCANDDCDWIKREIDWLDVPLAEEKPLLGICLGAQMMARALGARVFTYEDKRSEIGYFPIEPNAAADPLCAEPFPRSVYQWHSDGFDLPEGAELLATGGAGFPQPGLSLRQDRRRPAVPPRSHLSHDVPVDAPRRRAPDPSRRAARPAPSRRLVPARRAGRRLARRLPARVDGRAARRSVRAPRPTVNRPKPAGTPKHLTSRRAAAPAGRPASAAELVS